MMLIYCGAGEVHVIVGDGHRYLENTIIKYDAILNDAYIGYKSSASMQASAQLFHQ